MIKNNIKTSPAVSASGGRVSRALSARNGSVSETNGAKTNGTDGSKEEKRLAKKKALTLAAFASAYENNNRS